jgi:type I restriction enzyme S subunit
MNEPEIRFEGNSQKWIAKSLGEVFNKVMDKNTDYSVTETFTNSAQDGIVSQRDFFNHDISNDENINGYYVVKPDDFVYNPRMSVTAPVGPINRNKLGRAGVMSPLYTVFRAKRKDTELGYLEYFFKSNKWHDFMWKNGDNGARGDRFSIRDEVLRLMPIVMPSSKSEQKAIADFFDNLNQYIASEGKKLNKLCNLKNAYLEKMFPKDGEDEPEIRLGKYKGSWGHLKAKEIFSQSSEKGYPNLPVLSATQDQGMILRDNVGIDMTYSRDNVSSYKRVKPGQFVIHLRSFQGGFAHSAVEGITSPAYTVFGLIDQELHDDNFWKIYFTSNRFIKSLELVTYGIRDGRSIDVNGFMDSSLAFPSTKAEQTAIARFFDTLDTYIHASTMKIEKLKCIRKGLLERMFVGNEKED